MSESQFSSPAPVEPAADVRPFPGPRGAVLLVLLLIGMQVAGGVLLGIVLVVVDHTKMPVGRASLIAAGAVLIQLLSFVPVLGWGVRKTGHPWREVFPMGRFRPAILLPLLAAAGGLMILVSEADNWLRLLRPIPNVFAEPFRQLFSGGLPALVALVIVAPLTEELLFRGLILTGFLRRYGAVRAVIYSSILFALSHLNPYQFPAGLAMGLFLGWLYVRTRTLWPCMLMHAAFNAAVFFLPLLDDRWQIHIRGFSARARPGIVELQPAWFDGLGVLLVCLGVGIAMWLTHPVENLARGPLPPPTLTD
jgi:uncharacterized protein